MRIKSKENKEELITITKGTGIFASGYVFEIIISFGITFFLAKFLGSGDFGIYSLGLVVLSMGSIVARIGLNNGALKYVSVYIGAGDKEKAKGVMIQSIIFSFISGIIVGFFIYIFSNLISSVFDKPALAPVLEVIAFGVPFFSVLLVIGSVSRGFKTTKYEVLGIKVVKPFADFVLILIFFILGFRLLGMALAMVVAIVIAAFLSFFFLVKIFPELFLKEVIPRFKTKKLLLTSFPLMMIGILFFLIHWTDILMVGYFLSEESVGIYKVVIQIAAFVALSLEAFNSIFAPLISDLYHKGEKKSLNSLFKTVTRWGFFLSFSIFLIIASSYNEILMIFGEDFILGAISLLILSFAQLINAAVGGVGFMLMMTGRERLESLNTVVVLILNIILNLIFIPKIGILGAALATAISISIINIIRLIEVYLKLKIHPFDKKFLKGIAAGAFSFLVILIFKSFIFMDSYILSLIIFSCFLLVIFSFSLFLFKIEEEDKFILNKIKQKLL